MSPVVRDEEFHVAKQATTTSARRGERSPKAGRQANGRRRSAPAPGARAAKARAEAPSTAVGAEPRHPAPLTDGLDALDRDRASSLADEGGAAGAAVEAQPPARVTRSAAGKLWLAASWGLAGLAALYLRRSR